MNAFVGKMSLIIGVKFGIEDNTKTLSAFCGKADKAKEKTSRYLSKNIPVPGLGQISDSTANQAACGFS